MTASLRGEAKPIALILLAEGTFTQNRQFRFHFELSSR